MDYEYKTDGLRLLKKLVSTCRKNPKSKYITMSLEKAQTVIDEFENKPKQEPYSIKSNSVKAAAVSLCIPLEELLELLNAPKPKDVKKETAKLVSIGNAMYERAVKDGTGLWLSHEFQLWNNRNK